MNLSELTSGVSADVFTKLFMSNSSDELKLAVLFGITA